MKGESLGYVVANILDYNLKVSKFKFQSCYYIHFQTEIFGKSMKSFISSAVD